MAGKGILYIAAEYRAVEVREKKHEHNFEARHASGYFDHVVSVHPVADLVGAEKGRIHFIRFTPKQLVVEGVTELYPLPRLLLPVNFLLSQARLLTVLKRLVRKQKIDIVAATDPFLSGLLAWALSRTTGRPLLIRIGGNYEELGGPVRLRYSLGMARCGDVFLDPFGGRFRLERHPRFQSDRSCSEAGTCRTIAASGRRRRKAGRQKPSGARQTLNERWSLGWIEGRSAIRGDLCLALIMLVSALPYFRGLGFYSDDWGLLAEFVQGRTNLHEVLKTYPGRPLQGAYLLFQFKLFGLDPLGYHVLGTVVLGLCAIFQHRLLVRIGLGQAEAFAVAAITIVLPQMSTVRVWVAASQIPLSMLAALCSMHAQLSYVKTRTIGWIGIAALAAIVSVLLYEIFVPLILAFPFWLLLRGPPAERRRVLVHAVALAVVIILCGVLKVRFGHLWPMPRLYPFLSPPVRLFSPAFDWRVDEGLNIFAAADVYAWQLVKGWAAAASAVFTGVLPASTILVAAMVGILTWWGIKKAESGRPWRAIALGSTVIVLGHAVFFVLGGLMFSPSGLASRVSMAAAPGVALLVTGGVMLVAGRFAESRRHAAFSMGVAVIAAISTLRLAMVASHWVEASTAQARILNQATHDLSLVHAGATVVLTGVCPYRGPGVVFEARWDVGPALLIVLNRDLQGNIVTNRTRLGPTALETSIYGERNEYPYGRGLWFYEPGAGQPVRIMDQRAAREYFADRESSRCPPSYPGQGQLI